MGREQFIEPGMEALKTNEQTQSMRERVLFAAMDLFKVLPVNKITMEDVARAAGVVRSTVYKQFKNKEELLAALFSHEMRTNHHPKIRQMHGQGVSIDNLTDMFIAELELALSYVLLANTFDPSKIPGIGEMVLASPEIAEANRSLWVPILEDYRARNVIKPDIDLEQTVRWMAYQHVWLISHPHALTESEEERRTYVRTYIFGAIEQ